MKAKQFTAFAVILALSLCSCSEKSEESATHDVTEASASITEESIIETTDVPTDKTLSTEETEESREDSDEDNSASSGPPADMSRYGENAVFLSANEIYAECFDVGYIEGMPDALMITDKTQLEIAGERYPLYIPDDADENERWQKNNVLTGPFMEMTEKYPVDEYTYLLRYVRADGGGYRIKAAGIVIDEDAISFVDSPDSVYPGHRDVIPDVCSDYCYMAAVPKHCLSRSVYRGWLIPDPDNMYQDKDYKSGCVCYDTSDLYDIYGDTRYLIRTREEYDSFLAMSAHLRNMDGNRKFYDMKPDFDKVSVAAYFFTSSGTGAAHNEHVSDNTVVIKDDSIVINYKVKGDKGERFCTYMIYAFIPNRFLTGNSYDGWSAPKKTEPVSITNPVIDRSKYGKDAIILTDDDIFIYGSHSSSCDFSGKYVMHGDKGVSAVWDGLELYRDDQFKTFIDLKRYNIELERYPASIDNILFVQYNNFDRTGRDLYPYALVIDGNKAEFLYTENNNNEHFENRPDSYCFFAAVPEELLNNISFDGWNVYDKDTTFGTITEKQEKPDDPGEMYYKEPMPEDIETDSETGITYVKDQLLVSAMTDADRSDIQNIFDEIGAEIVGYIEITNDYQIEFKRRMTIEDLQNIADYIESYSFISNVMLNIVEYKDPVPSENR